MDKETAAGQVAKGQAGQSLPAWLETVRAQVASLKYGTILITVHDSRVIQIERLEKLRLDRPADTKGSAGK